jgi:hypothetical protein
LAPTQIEPEEGAIAATLPVTVTNLVTEQPLTE